MPRIPDPNPRTADRAALAVVALAALALVAYRVTIAVQVGPGWDTFAFLGNAADFAGKGFGYTEPHRAPLISLLTSFVFRFSALDQAAVQWVDGALSASGVVAFFLLARRRFDSLSSAAGALMLLAVQPLWEYLGVGYTDFASIALSLWLLLACIKATEEGPAYYLAAGALFTAAAMMRYTALLIAFPVAVWVLLRWRPFRHARWIAGAFAAAAAAYLPAAVHYTRGFGDALFPFIVAFGFSENVSAPGGEGQAQAAGGWYIAKIAEFLAPAGFEILAVAALAAGVLGLVRATGDYVATSRPRLGAVVRAAAGVGVGVLGQMGGGMVVRQATIPIAVLLVWSALAPRETAEDPSPARVLPGPALDAAMLTWLLTYFDFHGHQTIQVPRYVITMAPSLIYLTLLGWREWSGSLQRTRDALANADAGPTRGSYAIVGLAYAAIVVVLVAGTAYATPAEPDRFVASARESADALARVEPDLDSLTLYSDLWPLTSWYLRTNVRPMPSFEDTDAFAHELDKSGADYFFTIRARRFDGFAEMAHTGDVVVLERTAPAPDALPSVQYLGKSWDNYLESVTDFDFYLRSTAGRYGWEGSAFLDGLPAEELARHDAIAAYGWRHRDRATAEAVLDEYLRSGGSLVLDASQNLDGFAYSVAGTIMFDTFIRPGTVPRDARIELDPAFAANHPDLGSIDAAPFVSETGGAWAGATYEARPGTPELETLVRVGGRPAVQVRRVGEGSVYFVGYNLVWHAFSHENADEAALVRAIFDDAILRSREAGR